MAISNSFVNRTCMGEPIITSSSGYTDGVSVAMESLVNVRCYRKNFRSSVNYRKENLLQTTFRFLRLFVWVRTAAGVGNDWVSVSGKSYLLFVLDERSQTFGLSRYWFFSSRRDYFVSNRNNSNQKPSMETSKSCIKNISDKISIDPNTSSLHIELSSVKQFLEEVFIDLSL